MDSKLKSTKALDGAKGGTTKMFGKMGVVPSQEGVSAPTRRPGFDKNAPKGGPGGVMGKQGGARKAEAGKVTPAKSGSGGDNTFAVHGGSGRMFGKQGAIPATEE